MERISAINDSSTSDTNCDSIFNCNDSKTVVMDTIIATIIETVIIATVIVIVTVRIIVIIVAIIIVIVRITAIILAIVGGFPKQVF